MTATNNIPEDDTPPPVSEMSYWEIIAEIDASMFTLEEMARESASRAPIERMIDSVTGCDAYMAAEAKIIVARVKELQAALPPDDPHFVKEES